MHVGYLVCHLYSSIKEVLQMLPLADPFIEIGGKQKITIASICDKKRNLVKLFVNRQEI